MRRGRRPLEFSYGARKFRADSRFYTPTNRAIAALMRERKIARILQRCASEPNIQDKP